MNDNIIIKGAKEHNLKNINLTDVKTGGVNYNLVSADYLDFKLKRIR